MSYHYTPESGEAHFRNNVLIENTLKLAPSSAIESVVLDGRFTASNTYTDSQVASEAAARSTSITNLSNTVTGVSTTVSNNRNDFDSYVTETDQKLADELNNRAAGDHANSEALAAHVLVYNAGKAELEASIAQEVSDRQAAVSTESTARQNADTGLQSDISANTTLIGTEKASLKNELLYGAGKTEADADDNKIHKMHERLESVESQIDAFSPTTIEEKVAELITNHDTEAANLNSAVALLNEYFIIDAVNNSVSIKPGTAFNVTGTFNQSE
jgi:hypothetical protein